MNAIFRDQVLASACLTSLGIAIALIIASLFFANEGMRIKLRIASICAFGIAFFIMALSPRPKLARDMRSVTTLRAGCYSVKDVWQIGNAQCALVRLIRIDSVDKVNRSVAYTELADQWTICDVSGHYFVSPTLATTNHLATAFILVEERDDKKTVLKYNPFK